MPTLLSNINENSGFDVQEIIGYRPHWLIRNGNSIFALVILLLLFCSSLIRYPDILKGSLKIEAANAPILLVAKTEGRLDKIFIKNEQFVKINQILSFLQSTGDHAQVLLLQTWIQNSEKFINQNDWVAINNSSLPEFTRLGEIQSFYQEFQTLSKDVNQISSSGYYQRKIISLQSDIVNLMTKRANEINQEKLFKEDFDLQQKEYNANVLLANEKVIAPFELNQNKSKLIGKKELLNTISATIISINAEMQNKQKEILEENKTILDLRQRFRSSFFSLKSKIEEWIEKYIIIAPEDGKIFFEAPLQENEFVAFGRGLFYVQPTQNQFYGQMLVSQIGMGKVRVGQKVFIKLDSYPSTEFGFITGSVGNISTIPVSGDSFAIKIDLPRGLHTNYDRDILFRNSLNAQASIILDNRKLIDRILGRLKYASER